MARVKSSFKLTRNNLDELKHRPTSLGFRDSIPGYSRLIIEMKRQKTLGFSTTPSNLFEMFRELSIESMMFEEDRLGGEKANVEKAKVS